MREESVRWGMNMYPDTQTVQGNGMTLIAVSWDEDSQGRTGRWNRGKTQNTMRQKRSIPLNHSEELVKSSEFTQLKLLLLKHGYITLHVKDWWKDEPRNLREYTCNVDGMELTWRGILHHYVKTHSKIYELFVPMVLHRDFTLHNDLVYESEKIIALQTMCIELQKVEPRARGYSAPVKAQYVRTPHKVVRCECGGYHKDSKDGKAQHERTQMHQKYLNSITIPVPIYHH